MRRHDWPTSVLVLMILLAVHTVACAGSASPDTAAVAPRPSATSAATAKSVADTPTKRVSTTPTALERDVAQESDVPATPNVQELELSAETERVVELARRDLARRLGLALERIGLVSIETMQWPDASLGCPQPGKVYAQVVTPGFRVLLVAHQRVYEYHSEAARSVVLCSPGGLFIDPTPLLPLFPHGKASPKPKKPAH
jgi:hypothetical protein